LNADEADDFVFNTKLLLFISAIEWNDFMFFDGPFEQFLHFKGTFFLHYQPKFVFERLYCVSAEGLWARHSLE
jgi:hypothetical protein